MMQPGGTRRDPGFGLGFSRLNAIDIGFSVWVDVFHVKCRRVEIFKLLDSQVSRAHVATTGRFARLGH